MTANEVRNSFLKFFEERGHAIVPSASVIPYDDPTLLFTNAGMNQFKDVFLGTGKRDYVRVADSQKCIRVSGKHNDLEEVGQDTYHHTFFEMLGNWSFGDYYKKEAIGWAWELLTKVWGLDKKRLYATVFEEDDEAEESWKKVTDIDHSHIFRFGKKDNFWEMGETGPCGPCSEIHIDLTDDLSGGKLVNAGDPRVMEIWNLVFIQYNRDAGGNLTPLPAKHVDTGMGFERICAVLQGKKSNYDTDVFTPIIKRVEDITGKQYQGTVITDAIPQSEIDVGFRVIADHARMLTFSIADGGIPSNEGRGYVMRRILRRAARFGRTLGMHEPFIYKVVEAVVQSMSEQYSEIKEKQSYIERVIKGEEESFNATLDRGLEIFDQVVANLVARHVANQKFPSGKFMLSILEGKVLISGLEETNNPEFVEFKIPRNVKNELGVELKISGQDAFKLYDTYGFPLDLTEMMALERGLTVDVGTFTELMEEQRERARKAAPRIAFQKEYGITPDLEKHVEGIESHFVGYRVDEYEGLIYGVGPNTLMIDYTPFYPESGGQVGDTGVIEAENFRFIVYDTKREDKLIFHLGEPDKLYDLNEVREKKVRARIDKERRRNIERNHTATHIVHEALRRVLGDHLHQQGSLVAPDHLRFDFNHFEKVSPDELKAIEDLVNEKIAQSIAVIAFNDPKDWLTIEEAKKRYPNVKMFFGDKYGERVRIVEIDPKFSVELCGGTHVNNTREIGPFKIIAEMSVASGIRRIEAATGEGLNQYIQKRLEKIGELDEQLAKLIEEKEILERELSQYKKIEPTPRPSLGSVLLFERELSADAVNTLEDQLRRREETLEQISKTTFDLKKELSRFRIQRASSSIAALVESGIPVNGFKVVSARIEANDMEELKSLGDTLRSKLTSGVGILGTVVNDKVALVCVVTDDLIKTKKLQAGKIVSEIAKGVGGSGGGRAHMATAGGKDVAKLDDALKQVPSIIKSMLPS